MMKCEEAQKICDKSQYDEAGFWERKWLTFHLIICQLCRFHVTRNAKLTQLINKANLKSISKEQKEALKEQLRHEMSK